MHTAMLITTQLRKGPHVLHMVQLGAKDMAAAVREMMAAAGVPVDLERTNLLEKILRLQSELDSASAGLSKLEKARIPISPCKSDAVSTTW